MRFHLRCSLFTLLVCAVSARGDTETDCAPRESFRFGIGAVGRYEILLGHAAETWSSYPAVGLHVTLPTGVPKLHTRLGSSAAILLPSDRSSETDAFLVDLYWVCTYDFVRPGGRWVLSPFAGIVSTTVVIQSPSLGASEASSALSESEFGVAVGFEPRVAVRRLTVGLPIGLTCTFSAPHPLYRVTAGVALHYVHRRGGRD